MRAGRGDALYAVMEASIVSILSCNVAMGQSNILQVILTYWNLVIKYKYHAWSRGIKHKWLLRNVFEENCNEFIACRYTNYDDNCPMFSCCISISGSFANCSWKVTGKMSKSNYRSITCNLPVLNSSLKTNKCHPSTMLIFIVVYRNVSAKYSCAEAEWVCA